MKCPACGLDFDEILGQLSFLLDELQLLKNEMDLQKKSNAEHDSNQLFIEKKE
jgi:hypothetical protein